MKNNLPKQVAHKTLIKHKLYLLNNYTDLQRIIKSNQFTIIEYKKHSNSKHVSELIKRLRIENETQQNDSFLFIKNNLNLLFINTDTSVEDKIALLRHELGHICDPDFKKSDILYSKIQKEEFANEFSCFIKNPGICFMIRVFLLKKWKLLVSVIALITCVLGILFMNNTPTIAPTKPVTVATSTPIISDSTYYVTSSGEKYHLKHCVMIKYKNNLTEITLNDAINYGYKPCLICNPEE